MKYKWICRCLTAVLLATFIIYSGATAFAQGTTTATVEGVITDQQNAVVPGVKVRWLAIHVHSPRDMALSHKESLRLVEDPWTP